MSHLGSPCPGRSCSSLPAPYKCQACGRCCEGRWSNPTRTDAHPPHQVGVGGGRARWYAVGRHSADPRVIQGKLQPDWTSRIFPCVSGSITTTIRRTKSRLYAWQNVSRIISFTWKTPCFIGKQPKRVKWKRWKEKGDNVSGASSMHHKRC